MQGGAIDVNGAGIVMTTEQCLLNPNRNPHLERREIEQYLKDYYGQRHVVWLRLSLRVVCRAEGRGKQRRYTAGG